MSSRDLIALFCVFSITLSAGVSFAQDKTRIKHKLGAKTVTIAKPDGWVIAKSPKGSIGLFRAAGDKTSQIEIKFTPAVTKKQQTRYFQTFHTSLQKMGLKPMAASATPAKSLSSAKGFTDVAEKEYELKSNGKDFRMVVVQGYREGGVWMVIGFFPTAARTTHYETMQKILAGVVVK